MTAKKYLRPPYEFATAGNYPAGALPWSGQPSVVPLSNSVMSAGIVPDTPVDAPSVNYLEQIKADAITIQNHAAMNRWSRAQMATGSDNIAHVVPCRAPGASGIQNTIAVVGNKFSNSHALLGRSIDGVSPFSGGAGYDLGFANYAAVAADAFGTLFGGLVGGATCKSVQFDSTPTTATFTPTGLANQVEAAHYSVSHYLIAAAGVMYSATTLGGTWAGNSIGSVGDTITQIVDNGPGATTPRVVLAKTVASNSHRHLMYSADDGVTFTLGHDFGAVSVSLCYSPAKSLFVVLTSAGALWTSPDGAAWTLSKTTANLSGITTGTDLMASCGSAIAHLVNYTPVTGLHLRGIAYTFDLGATWNDFYFGDLLFGGVDLGSLISANGRLFCADPGAAGFLYSSGALESPATFYTGV